MTEKHDAYECEILGCLLCREFWKDENADIKVTERVLNQVKMLMKGDK